MLLTNRGSGETARWVTFAVFWLLCRQTVAQENAERYRPRIPPSERAALLELFASTGGENWKNRDGWGAVEGTECDWFGVSCDYSEYNQPHVSGLFLGNNNLTGTLPSELDNLDALRELLLYENKLSGAVPSRILSAFDDGRIRFLGYAGQFSPIIGIDLIVTPSAVICGHYEVHLKLNAPDTIARKVCRNATPADRATFWERSSGRVDEYEGDLDHIARLIERSDFACLGESYWRNITHGTLETVTVTYRDGTHKSVEDYAASAPAPMWLVKRAIAGAAFNGDWSETTRSKIVKE